MQLANCSGSMFQVRFSEAINQSLRQNTPIGERIASLLVWIAQDARSRSIIGPQNPSEAMI